MQNDNPNDEFLKLLAWKYNLTSRQLEVWELIRRGRMDNEIADELFLSKMTIADHRKMLYKRLREFSGELIRCKNEATALFMKEWQIYNNLEELPPTGENSQK